MVVLAGTLVSLVVSGRKQEKAAVKVIPHEIVRTSPATGVRMLAPRELQVADPGPDTSVEIRNSGATLFHRLLLKITYFDTRGRELETRDLAVEQPIGPGETIKIEVPSASEAPVGSVRRAVRVAYAETSTP